MNKYPEVYPKIEPAEDKVFRLAEVIGSQIPFGQQILTSLFIAPVQKRMESWIHEVEKTLNRLDSEKIIDIAEIVNSDLFQSIMLQNIQAVSITSQKEKLMYLHNFVVNSALGVNVEEDELYLLNSIIKEFTPSHIKVLQLYHDCEKYGIDISSINHSNIPDDLRQGRELLDVYKTGDEEYWQSLFTIAQSRRLVTQHSLDNRLCGSGTTLGRKLLSLIELEYNS
ncbi:hypothetical protein L4C31_21440 [Aliivibrio sifiae]